MPHSLKKGPRMATSVAPVKERVYTVEFEREQDGRWIAEVLELPGVLVYGKDKDEAFRNARALALRVISETEDIPQKLHFNVA
jgi:predicted RNase H-like HicB family nuclease